MRSLLLAIVVASTTAACTSSRQMATGGDGDGDSTVGGGDGDGDLGEGDGDGDLGDSDLGDGDGDGDLGDGDGDPGDGDGDGDAPPPTCNCGAFGDCERAPGGGELCNCQTGYVPQTRYGPCVEDLDCVDLEAIECRASYGGNTGAGNGILLSATYCSGRPYALRSDDLVVEERSGDAAFDLIDPDESLARVVPAATTPRVYFTVDISASVTADAATLMAVAEGMKHVLTRLAQQGSQFRVAVYLFDGSWYPYEFIPESTDLATIAAQLDTLHLQRGTDPTSTTVFGAVRSTLQRLERSIRLEFLASAMGTLGTGTLVVISEGDDRANHVAQADVEALIDSSTVRVVTVGVGEAIDHATLRSLGRDGYHRADTPDSSAAAFTAVADGIETFENSLAFVGHCASARSGQATTRIGVAGSSGSKASCEFDASAYPGGCGSNSLTRESTVGCLLPSGMPRECGGLLACGTCPPGECCSAGSCVSPTVRTVGEACATERHCESAVQCTGSPDAMTCEPSSFSAGDACDPGNVCDAGVLACESDDSVNYSCVDALAVGYSCGRAEDCISLHCGPRPPATAGPGMCLPVARMFESCRPGAVCEHGTYCETGIEDDVCTPQRLAGRACSSDSMCRSGRCTAGSCDYSAQCLFDFNLDIGPELYVLQ